MKVSSYFYHGSYHALVNARKPKGIEDKSAYLIGTGIASLAAGCFLIRDAHMDGEKLEIKLPKLVKHELMKKMKDTDIEALLKEYKLI